MIRYFGDALFSCLAERERKGSSADHKYGETCLYRVLANVIFERELGHQEGGCLISLMSQFFFNPIKVKVTLPQDDENEKFSGSKKK